MSVKESFVTVIRDICLMDAVCAGCYTEGHGSSGESLTQADDIWFCFAERGCEQLTRSSEAGHYFVGNAKDAMVTTGLKKCIKCGRLMHHHATGGLHQR